jgi:hypothetical protein
MRHWTPDDWEIAEDMIWPVGGSVALVLLAIAVWWFG